MNKLDRTIKILVIILLSTVILIVFSMLSFVVAVQFVKPKKGEVKLERILEPGEILDPEEEEFWNQQNRKIIMEPKK